MPVCRKHVGMDDSVDDDDIKNKKQHLPLQQI